MAVDPVAVALALRNLRFPPTSRYNTVGVSTLQLPDGRTVAYLQRRFTPDPARFHLLLQHVVTDATERLDGIAAEFLGDPLQSWRVADANGALRYADLVQVGRTVRITLPGGLMGPGGA